MSPVTRFIADWDLWPWMVADGYGGILAVQVLRAERSVAAMALVMGRVLLPAFQRLAVSMSEATAAFRALGYLP